MKATKFKPLLSHGSYFQLYSYADLSNEKETDFAKRLTIEAKVATIPASAFYKNGTDNQVIRFCFVKSEITLKNAVDNLINFELTL